jgi:cytoskeleton protein RodZ
MAKRDPEIEAADAEPLPEVPPTVGERLREAREGRGLSLEDVAAQTRIPQRHLTSIETGDWDSLPAPTYTIGFAKNYAAAVGLDRTEIGDQLREEMGGQRFAATSADVFEPADPRRTMPKPLVIGTVIAALLLIVVMSVLNRRSLDQNEPTTNAATAPATTTSTAPSAPAPPAPVKPSGPVVLMATGPAWIQVTDQGRTLFQGELQPGQSYTVPATVTAPMLKAGKPEALKVSVGATTVPQIGPAGKVTTVSLLPPDLLKATAAPAPAPKATAGPAPAVPPAKSRRRAQRPAPVAPTRPVQPPTTQPVVNSQ